MEIKITKVQKVAATRCVKCVDFTGRVEVDIFGLVTVYFH